MFLLLGELLVPTMPLVAVSFLAVLSSYVFWLMLNTVPSYGGRFLTAHSLPNIYGEDWFVFAFLIQATSGFFFPRAFLIFTLLFWQVVVVLYGLLYITWRLSMSQHAPL